MKSTVVPAQVTTVEDRIMGSLGFSQLMLFIAPVFIGAAVFAVVPPVMEWAPSKYIGTGSITFLSCLLAVRIKGKIIAVWLAMIARYTLRPKQYLFDKNTAAYRNQHRTTATERDQEKLHIKPRQWIDIPRLAPQEILSVLAAIDNPASKLRFETTKKGGLNVHLTDIQDERE